MDLYISIAQTIYSLSILGAVTFFLFRSSQEINQTIGANWPSAHATIFLISTLYLICISSVIILFQLERIPPEPVLMYARYFILPLLPAIIIALCAWQFRNPEGSELPPLSRKIIVGIGSGCLLFYFAVMLANLWPSGVTMSSELSQFTESLPLLMTFSLFAVLAAIVEEIIFRLGIQGILERHLPKQFSGTAIIITSVIFMLGHSGLTEQLAFKEIQILITGIVLGTLKVRYGLSASIIAHVTMNLIITLSALSYSIFGTA